MKTKEEIINLYLDDLKNIVPQSPARDNRIAMLESELTEEKMECHYPGADFIDCLDWKNLASGCGDCVKYHKNR